MEALNLTRGPSMHWEVVGVKQYNPTSPPEKKIQTTTNVNVQVYKFKRSGGFTVLPERVVCMGVHGGSAAGTSGLGLGGNCVQGEVSCVANVDVSALCGVLHSGVGLVSGGTTSEECSVL